EPEPWPLHTGHPGPSKAREPRRHPSFPRPHFRRSLPTRLVRPGKSIPARSFPLARPDPPPGSITAGPPVTGRNEPEREPRHEPLCVPLHVCSWPAQLPDPSGPCHSLTTRCYIALPKNEECPACVRKLVEECSPPRGSGPGRNRWPQGFHSRRRCRDG